VFDKNIGGQNTTRIYTKSVNEMLNIYGLHRKGAFVMFNCRINKILIVVIGICIIWGGTLGAGSLLGNTSPESADIVIYSPPSKMDFCGEPTPLERASVAESFEEAFLGVVYFHSRTILWLKRSARFFPYIEKKLKERGMPSDLKYILVAESSFRHDAVSSARAVGFWQFMEPTAKRIGLRVDKWIDERRNFERSTEAALNYLAELYSLFGSWTLATAAYNCGENRLRESIETQGTRNYYDLKLPAETEMYIFRILAAKALLCDPARYGYRLDVEQIYKPLSLATVDIILEDETLLVDIAGRFKTTYKEIRDLNPEIRLNSLPPGKYTIKVPSRKETLRMPRMEESD